MKKLKYGSLKKGMTMIEIGVVVAILSVLVGAVFNYGFQYVTKVNERKAIESVETVISDFETSNYTGRGFDKDRIKYQVMVFRDESPIIDIYYYKEFFDVDDNGNTNPIPQTEFYGMQRLDLSEDNIIFEFDETDINGGVLAQRSDTNDYLIGIRRELPHNDMLTFDAGNPAFDVLNETTMVDGKTYSIYGKGIIQLYEDSSGDEKGITPGSILANLGPIEMNVKYKNNINIGTIKFNPDTKRIYFTNRYEESGN